LLWLFRYVSLSSMCGSLVLLAGTFGFGYSWPIRCFAAFAVLIVVARHRANVGRLLHGTEPRVLSFGRGRGKASGASAG
jgi:glycerol-3-phosphate acyltransferase PlsY